MANRWETNIKPYLSEIEKWSKVGKKNSEIADKLNVSYSTFRKYATSEAELKQVLKNGKNHVERTIEKALNNQGQIPKSVSQPMTYYTPNKNSRPDQNGPHRQIFEKNKKRIYATQTECGICGKPIDKKLKYPNPLAPCIDHIIPVSKGGHPSDISNLQLAHWTCNRTKSDKMLCENKMQSKTVISNRILPQSTDWSNYKSK